MTRPRICLVFPHLGLGGGETAMMAVGEGLGREVQLEVCALDHPRPEVEQTIREELLARFGRVTWIRERWQLAPALAAADGVVWYGPVNRVPRALAALARRSPNRRPASIRVVHTERDEDGLPFHRRWRRVIDATVCVSPAVARRIPGASFVPNPADPARLRGEGRRFFADHRPTLGWLGRLVPLKNVDWLVANLEALGCNLLVQALDTPWLRAADLAALARERGVGDRVRFLPPGREVGALLRSVDALAVVSRQEGFPMVVVEAGMLDVPVIATRVGALPELFADEIPFVEGDGEVPRLDSLRRALARVDPVWGARLGAKVRRLCAPEVVAARYAEILHRVLDPATRPAASGPPLAVPGARA